MTDSVPPSYRLVRSQRRTLAITLDSKGAVTVRAPAALPLRRIEAFLREKTPWILSKQALLRSQNVPWGGLKEGAVLPYLGGEIRIAYSDQPKASLSETTLYLPRKGDPLRHALDWFYHSAARELPAYVNRWAGRMNVYPASLSFGHARKRWGSMSSAGALRLNIALVHCAPNLIDYVVVHELAHRVYPNHSKAFHAYVESVLPGAEALRKQVMKDAAPYLGMLRAEEHT